ncbi:MAG: type II toxin-antitoxin system HicB family antitoxin [Oscillospiraceae bacterium]|nr:type II toxin-antitoxin system HicB family antitoxin [Oscillospiraceae bacterium]
MSYKFTIIIQKEEISAKGKYQYVAKCAENNVASQGKTLEEAVDNLREAVELYYEDNYAEKPIQLLPVFISTMEVSI